MKFIVVLLAFLIAVGLSVDCNNPLLTDSTIRTNIGTSNVASSVQTAGSGLPICKWLSGKNVCTTTYDTLSTAIENQKEAFKTSSDNRNRARWGDIDPDIDVRECIHKVRNILSYTEWITAHVTSSGTVDFNGLQAKAEADWEAYQDTAAYENDVNEADAMKDAIDDQMEQYVRAKANCTSALFSWVIYLNCLATDADYASKLSGSGSNTQVFVKQGTCDQFSQRCRPYFTAAREVSDYASRAVICSSELVDDLVEDINEDYDSEVNTRLNGYITNPQFLAEFGGASGQTDVNTFIGLGCGVNSNAGDCDFICKNVLTTSGSGFNMNAYLNLNPGITNRLLQNNRGPTETGNGPDMFVLTADEDTTVDEDEDPLGDGENSAFKLGLSLSLLLALAFLL